MITSSVNNWKFEVIIIAIFVFCSGISASGYTVLPSSINSDMTLIEEDSPYLINSDVNVGENAVLTISPGVVIYVDDGKSLRVTGIFKSVGNSENPINIYPLEDNGKGIRVVITEYKAGCEIAHTNLINGIISVSKSNNQVVVDNINIDNNYEWPTNYLLIHIYDANIRISNSRFTSNNSCEGIFAERSIAFIQNCYFDYVPDAIEYNEVPEGYIRNCTVMNSRDDAIDFNGTSNILVEGNFLLNSADKGFSIGFDNVGKSHDILLKNNIVVGCDIGINVKSAENINLINNTFHGNRIAIKANEKFEGAGYAEVVAKNCILSNSEIDLNKDDSSSIDITYSLSTKEILSGKGNLYGDPGFIDPEQNDFRLLSTSICIDAGDPNTEPDPDGTRADIGAWSNRQDILPIVINEINYNSPADFDPGDWIELFNPNIFAVDIGGWKLRTKDESQDYNFPSGTLIRGVGYLILCSDSEKFEGRYPNLDSTVDLDFDLSNNGDMLLLIAAEGTTEDSVMYGVSVPWPSQANGQGPSLELTNFILDNSLAASWSATTNHGTPGRINSLSVISKDPGDGYINIYVEPHPVGFNSELTIKPGKHGRFVVELYDQRGCLVKRLFEGLITADGKRFVPDWPDLVEGVYLLQVRAPGRSAAATTIYFTD